MSRPVWLLTTVLAALAVASTALAHPLVDRGVQHYEEARFDRALRAFQGAERRSDLTREDLVLLLATRALVYHADGAQEAMEADLLRLASLEPRHAFGSSVPPRVQQTFARIRGGLSEPLTLEVDIERTETGLRLAARVRGDDAGLVRRVSLATRIGESFEDAENAAAVIEAPDDATVEYYAHAIGPGGAVVVEEGSPDSPRSVTPATLDAAGSSEVVTETRVRTRVPDAALAPDDEDESGASALPWLVGGAVAAAVTVGLIVLLGSGGQSDETVLSPPMGDF